NLSSRPQAGLTLLEELSDPRPGYPEWRRAHRAAEKRTRSFRVATHAGPDWFKPGKIKAAEIPRALARQEVEAQMAVTPLRRGNLRFAAVTLARPDPLGLYRALCRAELPQTALILPKRYPVPPLMLPGSIKYQDGGVAMASKVGQSEEFIALRDYRPGDPLRHIHWRSWAKAGRPVVREFEDEFFVRHALVLDTFADHPHSQLFEEAVSVAASF